MNNHFIRKMKKLKRDPEAFFRDSRLNFFKKVEVRDIKKVFSNELKNMISTEVSSALEKDSMKQSVDVILRKKESVLNVISKFDFDYLLDRLRAQDTVGVFIKPLDPLLKPALCVLDKHRVDFLGKFLAFTYEEGIGLKYKYKGSVKTPKTVSEFYSDLLEHKFIDIRLSSDRLLDEKLGILWFRLEFCDSNDEFITFPTSNHISRRLWKHSISENEFFKHGLHDYSSLSKLPHESEVEFEIDLVFTWVNSDDPEWQEMYAQFKPNVSNDATSNSRFKSRDELKYAIRSWEKYGSFINNIYVVSNCKPPSWLNVNHPRIKWVYHEEILPKSALPTFSSHAIETSLHRIKGLSNHFIYSNDDFFLVRPVSPLDFFYSNGIAKLRLEPFGNVNGNVRLGDPDYLNAARNSNELLERDFGKTTTQLHTHSPQSMRVDVLSEMNDAYAEDFHRTVHNKFREVDDIAVTGYLYHHYALLSGRALDSTEKTELIQQNHNFTKKIDKIIDWNQSNDFRRLPLSVCLNDGNDSHLNDKWNIAMEKFLESLYPEASSLEL